MKPLPHIQIVSKKLLSAEKLISIVLIILYLLYAIGNMYSQRDLIFDDAFITYRYSKNLANGYGITWNPGEAPAEGYTNFLLVVILAPFIKLGADPLQMTRVLSVLSAVGISLSLYSFSRCRYNVSSTESILITMSFLLLTNTEFLCMVGLETVLYTMAAFLSFITISKYLDTRKIYHGYLSGLACFITFLLRPEIVLVLIAFVCVVVFIIKEKWCFGCFFRLTWSPLFTFALPLLVYLVGKYLHFGTLIPNSYYLKVSTPAIFSPLGLSSVKDFIFTNRLFLITATLSFFLTKTKNFQPERWLAGLFCLFYLLFYLRVDTLMDIGNRFLYPLIIFLVYLSIPTISRFYAFLLRQPLPSVFKVPLILGVFSVFILVLNPLLFQQTTSNLKAIISNDRKEIAQDNSLMQKEYRVALKLRRYPGIKEIRIAFGDAGVIPYFSEALSLDDVGLNDNFIAREKRLDRLTDYYFQQRPELAILASKKNHKWFEHGHGPLGNFSQWSKDMRWDEYAYAGTLIIEYGYDLQLFVRKDFENLENFDKFFSFLRFNVADGYYDKFPIRIGSYKPEKGTHPNWISN